MSRFYINANARKIDLNKRKAFAGADTALDMELEGFEWRCEAQTKIDSYLQQTEGRPSVDDWLKEQHTKHLLARLPQFERDTHAALDELHQELRHSQFKSLILSWLIAGLVIVMVIARLGGGL